MLEYIAKLISEGYRSGIGPTWSLTLQDEKVWDDEDALEHIAKLVKEGYKSGYEPCFWSIEHEEEKIEMDED